MKDKFIRIFRTTHTKVHHLVKGRKGWHDISTKFPNCASSCKKSNLKYYDIQNSLKWKKKAHHEKFELLPFTKPSWRKRLVLIAPGWSEFAVISTPSSSYLKTFHQYSTAKYVVDVRQYTKPSLSTLEKILLMYITTVTPKYKHSWV